MKKFTVGISVLLISGSIALAKDITLKEAINTALENSFELNASKKLLKAKNYEYQATKGMRYPTIKFTEMFMRTNTPGWAMMNTLNQERLTINSSAKFVDMTAFNRLMRQNLFQPPSYPEVNNWQTKLELQIPIFTGFKISTGIEMKKKDYEATKKDVKRTQQKVIYDVSKAYYGALLAKRAIKLAEQAIKSAEKHYKTAQKMYEVGLAIKADVLRAKVYLENAKAKLEEAKNQYYIAKKGLLLAMGVDDVKPEDIEVIGELKFEDTDKSVEYWQNYAIQNRPDLKAVEMRVKIAKKMGDFYKADFFPMIGAFASYEMDDNKTPFGSDGKWWTAGIALNWKLFDGFQNLNKYRAVREQYRQYKSKEKGFKEFIKFKVYEAYRNLQTAKAKLNTAKKNSQWAKEVLEITERRYKNQMATMIDLLDTQTLYDKTLFDLAKAVYDAKVSLLELKYQAGALNVDNLETIKKEGGDK